MKIDRINYQKTFNLGNYMSERIGMEAQLEPGDNPEQSIIELKKAVEDLHRATNPGLYVTNTMTGETSIASNVVPDNTKSAMDWHIEAINDCTSIDETNKYGKQIGLLAYEHLTATPRINEAYQKKLKELQNG